MKGDPCRINVRLLTLLWRWFPNQPAWGNQRWPTVYRLQRPWPHVSPCPRFLCAWDLLKCLCCRSLVCHACLSTCNTGSWYQDSLSPSLPPFSHSPQNATGRIRGYCIRLSVGLQASDPCSILVYNLHWLIPKYSKKIKNKLSFILQLWIIFIQGWTSDIKRFLFQINAFFFFFFSSSKIPGGN